MSRAIFVSACGDPFILSFCLKMLRERCNEAYDKVYVCYNNHVNVPLEVCQEFVGKAISDPKLNLIYHPVGIGNGVPITEMTLISKEDYVMLLEDDGYFFDKQIIEESFKKLENNEYDVVGSPRFSCGNEVGQASKVKYNLDYSGYGDVGCNQWPNFFFCKRSDLMKTDLNFGSYKFNKGQYCKELEHTFIEDNYGDTFVWACVQMRAMGLRYFNIPQFHADPYEIENKEKGEMNWINGKPSHMHAGSLSAGWGGYLQEMIPDITDESAKREMETRCAWWTIVSSDTQGYEDFKKRYKLGIENLIDKAKLNRDRIDKKIDIYRGLL